MLAPLTLKPQSWVLPAKSAEGNNVLKSLLYLATELKLMRVGKLVKVLSNPVKHTKNSLLPWATILQSWNNFQVPLLPPAVFTAAPRLKMQLR